MQTLWTDAGRDLAGQPDRQPWQVYPRPQMRRGQWLCLNGWWDFAVSEKPEIPGAFDRRIRVPFCPESALSGIGEHFPEGSYLYYRLRVRFPESWQGRRILLHVGAADQEADIFVNGRHLTRHEGGYDPFSCDITQVLKAENEILIRCRDDLRDRSYPYGKQTMSRGGMWYTPVSGIWQTVWAEPVPKTYIPSLRVENRGRSVTIDTGREDLTGRVTVEGLGTFPLARGAVTITPEAPRLWSPEDPYLYPFTLEAGEDRVESYFALRTLEIRNPDGYPRLFLNGRPYFFHGLLDQGYWPDGLFTPAAPECFAQDILAMKRLGFNTLRKHIKVEPEEFYYQCDKLGMIVWQDMVNNGGYRFLRDTVLPTAGLQVLPDRHMHRDRQCRERFLAAMERTVGRLGGHGCVCCWTVFNEGWGQFEGSRAYRLLKDLDDTRFINTVSGWFRGADSDLDSRHIYFGKLRLRGGGKKPLVLTEFGGKTYKAQGHVFNPEKTYGYGSFETLEAYRDAVAELYVLDILPAVEKGLCAAVYTQVSDVEDEINGLVTYDRQVQKLEPDRMLPIAQALQAALEG